MDTEKRLRALLDFQRFERDPALQSVLDEVKSRYFGEELSDDALSMLSAAGDPFSQTSDPKKREEPL